MEEINKGNEVIERYFIFYFFILDYSPKMKAKKLN